MTLRDRATRVEENGNFEQAILTVDHGRPGNLPNVRKLPKRTCAPPEPVIQDIRDFIRVAAGIPAHSARARESVAGLRMVVVMLFSPMAVSITSWIGADIDARNGRQLRALPPLPDVEIERAGHRSGLTTASARRSRCTNLLAISTVLEAKPADRRTWYELVKEQAGVYPETGDRRALSRHPGKREAAARYGIDVGAVQT